MIGIGPVWVWYHPDAEENEISYAEAADGRVAVAHPWSDIDREWIAAYCEDLIKSGMLVITDRLPDNWEAKGERL